MEKDNLLLKDENVEWLVLTGPSHEIDFSTVTWSHSGQNFLWVHLKRVLTWREQSNKLMERSTNKTIDVNQ